MTKEIKMTEKQALAFVIVNFNSELPTDVKEKLQKMLDKRTNSVRAKSEKDIAKEKERDSDRERILEILRESDKAMTIAEIKAKDARFECYSSSKMSYLLRGLYDSRMTSEVVVERTVVKKVAHFRAI